MFGQCIFILMVILPIVINIRKFVKMLMLIFSVNMVMLILQANRECAHGLMRKFGKWWKYVSWCKANKKIPKKIICKECTYVQKDRNKVHNNFDTPLDNKHTFSASYVNEEPIVDMKFFEDKLKSMTLYRVQTKGN